MDTYKYRVKVRDLRKKCNPSLLKFESTADIEPLRAIIGQERAVRALSLGLDVSSQGYNVFLAGPAGTGKSTLAGEMLENKAARRPIPPDWCYVFNFKNPDMPRALQLQAGLGSEFKKDIEYGVKKVIESISKAFEGEEYEVKKNTILNYFLEETNKMYLQLDQEARTHGFTISRSPNGIINTMPIKLNGEVLTQEEYLNMNEAERLEMMEKSVVVQDKLNEALRKYKESEKAVREKIRNLEEEISRSVAAPFFTDLLNKYQQHEELVEHIQAMQEDLLENTDLFIKREENSTFTFFRNIDRRASLRRYQVNLIADNSGYKHAPVIFESNPTYANLFGQIEYEGEFGILATDFSKIKAGTIHYANGGYLVINIHDLLKNSFVWDRLKKVIKNREIKVENISRAIGISNTETLEPEPIPVDIKVVLIGESWYYYLLYNYDEEFRKLFKIRADFDVEMKKTPRRIREYAKFIAHLCHREKLRHLTPQAVAAVVDYSSRMAEDQRKLTTLFNKLMEIVQEANYWATKDKAVLVDAKHVEKAIAEKLYRCSMIEEKIQENINRGTLIINTDGYKCGELNGLAVYQIGEHLFGRPVRITAKTFMGEKGLVNIEREILMSGSIHSKGVLTLNGYLGAQYAQDKPLTLSASLTFEQSYQGVEGDSASSAELYALLSSLAEVPLYQGIAVTGSVNQNGEIQPVGGVNHKIEGFYRTCLEKGLNGKQGVIIPAQNVVQLMLADEVVEAVRQKRFNIWAVKHIDEGIKILTGLPAGKKDETGVFEPGTVHYLVNKKLADWSNKRSRSFRKETDAGGEYHRKRRRRR